MGWIYQGRPSASGRFLPVAKDGNRPIVDVQQLQNSAKRCLGRKKSGLAVPDLAASSGLSVLDSLPQGMPGFTIPWITNANIVPMLIVGCAVALVSFADTDLLSRVYAARTRTYVDPNQEMAGQGVVNLAAGFF